MVDSGQERPEQEACDMADLQERVTTLEANADNQTKAIEGLRSDVSGLRAETAGLRTDIAELRGEVRTSVAQLRNEMATRGDLAEVRREMVHRFEITDAKIDRQFTWMVGLMVSGFFVIVGALVGVAFRIQ